MPLTDDIAQGDAMQPGQPYHFGTALNRSEPLDR